MFDIIFLLRPGLSEKEALFKFLANQMFWPVVGQNMGH